MQSLLLGYLTELRNYISNLLPVYLGGLISTALDAQVLKAKNHYKITTYAADRFLLLRLKLPRKKEEI